MEKVFEIYIKTTPERLWEAITNPGSWSKYNFGAGGCLRLDARLEIRDDPPRGGGTLGEGENIEVDPPRRLVQSANMLWSDEVEERTDARASRGRSSRSAILAG